MATIYDSKTKKVDIPPRRLFNGHLFTLFCTAHNKNRANAKANRCRKHGFHTKVIELYPGDYAVYRCLKRDGEGYPETGSKTFTDTQN